MMSVTAARPDSSTRNAPNGHARRTSATRREQPGALWQLIVLQLLPLVALLTLWQVAASASGRIDIPGAWETIRGVGTIVVRPEFWAALLESNYALVIGYLAAVAIGIPLGLLIGRSKLADGLTQAWLSILLITPMAMVIPLIIMAMGFGLAARSLIVGIFVLPMIVVNARAGVRTVPPQLIEMGRVFGASELSIWGRVLVPWAAPAIFTGLRIGIGRAVTGMVIAEWMLAAVGVGALLLQYRGSFQGDLLFAVVIIVLIESLVLVQLLRMLERRVVRWKK